MGGFALDSECHAIGSFRLDLEIGYSRRLAQLLHHHWSCRRQTCGDVIEVLGEEVVGRLRNIREGYWIDRHDGQGGTNEGEMGEVLKVIEVVDSRRVVRRRAPREIFPR